MSRTTFADMASEHVIVGIDPGLSSGGLVAVAGRSERVVVAHSLVRPGVPSRSESAGEPQITGDRNFTLAAAIAAQQALRIAELVDEIAAVHRILRIGVESFVDQRSRAREERDRLVKDRWKTPLVIGYAAALLAQRGFHTDDGSLVYQDAATVLRQFSAQLAALRDSKRTEPVCENDQLLTNDHMRTAWAHAVWLAHRTGRDIS